MGSRKNSQLKQATQLLLPKIQPGTQPSRKKYLSKPKPVVQISLHKNTALSPERITAGEGSSSSLGAEANSLNEGPILAQNIPPFEITKNATKPKGVFNHGKDRASNEHRAERELAFSSMELSPRFTRCTESLDS